MKRRRAEAIAEAERLAGVPWAEIRMQAEARGCPLCGPVWDRAVCGRMRGMS
jgi:hypothetical protein